MTKDKGLYRISGSRILWIIMGIGIVLGIVSEYFLDLGRTGEAIGYIITSIFIIAAIVEAIQGHRKSLRSKDGNSESESQKHKQSDKTED